MKKSLLWFLLIFFLISSFAVVAQGEIDNIVETFGGLNLADTYERYPQFFDFVIFAIIFITISVYSLGKAFPGKTGKVLGAVIGIALTIAFMVWENSQGFTVRDFGPIASLVIMVVVGIVVYKFVRMTKIGGTYSVLLAIAITFSVIEAIVPNVFDWVEQRGGAFLLAYSFIKVAVWASVILLIVKGVTHLTSIFKKSSEEVKDVTGLGGGKKGKGKGKGGKDKGKDKEKGGEKGTGKKPYSTPSIESEKQEEELEKEVEKEEKYAIRELHDLKKIEKAINKAKSNEDLLEIKNDELRKLEHIERRMNRRYKRLSEAAKKLAAAEPGVEEEEEIYKAMEGFRTYTGVIIAALSKDGVLEFALAYPHPKTKWFKELGEMATEKSEGGNFEARKKNSLTVVRAVMKWDEGFYLKLKEFEKALKKSEAVGEAASKKESKGARYHGGARF